MPCTALPIFRIETLSPPCPWPQGLVGPSSLPKRVGLNPELHDPPIILFYFINYHLKKNDRLRIRGAMGVPHVPNRRGPNLYGIKCMKVELHRHVTSWLDKAVIGWRCPITFRELAFWGFLGTFLKFCAKKAVTYPKNIPILQHTQKIPPL